MIPQTLILLTLSPLSFSLSLCQLGHKNLYAEVRPRSVAKPYPTQSGQEPTESVREPSQIPHSTVSPSVTP